MYIYIYFLQKIYRWMNILLWFYQGRTMVAAGYAVYGVSTLLVLASAGGAALYQVEHKFSQQAKFKEILCPRFCTLLS